MQQLCLNRIPRQAHRAPERAQTAPTATSPHSALSGWSLGEEKKKKQTKTMDCFSSWAQTLCPAAAPWIQVSSVASKQTYELQGCSPALIAGRGCLAHKCKLPNTELAGKPLIPLASPAIPMVSQTPVSQPVTYSPASLV